MTQSSTSSESYSLAHGQGFQSSRLLSADELVIFKKAIAMVLGSDITPDLLDVISSGDGYAWRRHSLQVLSFSAD